MNKVSAEIFPQFSVGGGGETPQAYLPTTDSKSFIYADGAIHNRPQGLIAYSRTQRGLRLVYATAGTVNRLTHTHETAVFQMESCPASMSHIYMEIEVWDEDIFRVRYSAVENPIDPYRNIPREAQMLVGEPKDIPFTVTEEGPSLRLQTASRILTLNTQDYAAQIADIHGHILFRLHRENLFTSDVLPTSIASLGEETAVFESLYLEQDEEIFGLGERFDSVSRKGRQVDFWNKDAIGTTNTRSYINVPFLFSTKGYGLFLNSSAKTNWEIGTRDASALGFSVLDDQMDYFVISRQTPADILKGYCSLTGFTKLPPLWSFGLWMSRNSYTTWQIAEQVGDEMRSHDIPCDVLHLDTAWFKEDWNCDLRFSEDRFPEPEKHMAQLKEKGFHVSLWQYNFLPPKENNANYVEACRRGFTAKDADGNVFRLPKQWKGSWVDDVVIDFTNPEARDWYAAQIEGLMKMGAGAIKTDFGEGIPEDACYHSLDGKYIHNLYSLIYNYTIWKATKAVTGEDIVWARSGTAGSQRFPLHWGGDSQCTFSALAGTLRGALSAGLSGIAFFSHDIGGFIGLPTPELYVRWAQMGMFSSHSRCHGAGDHTYREPWKFGKEAEDIFRDYVNLRYSLMPYIWEQAMKCTETGLPMKRSLILEFPTDKNVYPIEDQYMFGENLLIAPIMKPLAESNVRSIYLPAGTWTDYWTKEPIVSNGEWITRIVDLKTMPIYVRSGAVLKYVAPTPHLDDSLGEIVKVEEY